MLYQKTVPETPWSYSIFTDFDSDKNEIFVTVTVILFPCEITIRNPSPR